MPANWALTRSSWKPRWYRPVWLSLPVCRPRKVTSTSSPDPSPEPPLTAVPPGCQPISRIIPLYSRLSPPSAAGRPLFLFRADEVLAVVLNLVDGLKDVGQ